MQNHYICVTEATKSFRKGQEEAFKKYKTTQWQNEGNSVLWIESPETAVGCPDTIEFENQSAMLYEFKVSDENGDITFDKSQPLFYKKNGNIPMRVIAYDSKNHKEVVMDTDTALAAIVKKISTTINLKKTCGEYYE